MYDLQPGLGVAFFQTALTGRQSGPSPRQRPHGARRVIITTPRQAVRAPRGLHSVGSELSLSIALV